MREFAQLTLKTSVDITTWSDYQVEVREILFKEISNGIASFEQR